MVDGFILGKELGRASKSSLRPDRGGIEFTELC